MATLRVVARRGFGFVALAPRHALYRRSVTTSSRPTSAPTTTVAAWRSTPTSCSTRSAIARTSCWSRSRSADSPRRSYARRYRCGCWSSPRAWCRAPASFGRRMVEQRRPSAIGDGARVARSDRDVPLTMSRPTCRPSLFSSVMPAVGHAVRKAVADHRIAGRSRPDFILCTNDRFFPT